MTGPVWYAAFGSNLWGPRFLTYLTGGPVIHSPAGRVQAGARDPSAPLDARPVVLPHELFFARSSSGWGGGGVAFLDPGRRTGSAAATLGRLWLITRDQFADLASQENGHPVAVDAVNTAVGAGTGHLDVGPGWYARLLHLGSGPDGYPILTFSCPRPDAVSRRPAHPSYLRVVGLGLIETWSLSPTEAARYLAQRDGNAGLDAAALAEDLTRWSARDR